MTDKIPFTSDYICNECGRKYGKPSPGVHTAHSGECGVCGETRTITNQRNYGYPLEDKTKFEYVEETEQL